MKLSILLFVCCNLLAVTTVKRVACGGNGGVDLAGNVWEGDNGFSGGAAWTSSNQPELVQQNVPYKTLRYSNPVGSDFSYSFDLAPASYTVVLKFLEPNKTGAGQRQFQVALQDSIVVSPDLFALAGGKLVIFDYKFQATVGLDRQLKIVFNPIIGNAVVSGIEIDTIDIAPEGTTVSGSWMSSLIPGPDSSYLVRGARHGLVADQRCPLWVFLYVDNGNGKRVPVTVDWEIDPSNCDVLVKMTNLQQLQSNYYIVIK